MILSRPPNIVLLAAACAILLVGTPASGQSLPGTGPLAADPDFSATMLRGLHALADRLTEQSKWGRRPSREKLAAARAICLPDADTPPEACLDPRLLASGCEVVIMALVSRGTDYSTTDRLGIRTNVPHREWIYRQSYALGRHPLGYEVQKALAVVDIFAAQPDRLPVIAAGVGEGGMLALHAAALDERIDAVFSAGSFGPREAVWREPLDRNVCGLLRDSGDAEIAALVAPRPVVVMHAGYPEHVVSLEAPEGVKAIAAPGRLTAPTHEAFAAEIERARGIAPTSRIFAATGDTPPEAIIRHLLPTALAERVAKAVQSVPQAVAPPEPAADAGRQNRLIRDLERFSQELIVATEAERDARFWKQMPYESLADYEARMQPERERMWRDVFGRLPDPDVPIHPRSRLVRETDTVAIHEITLDVWDGVFAWGWLCLPKDLPPGERRPVVVCQHGLEGLPEDTVNDDPSSRAWGYYKTFALRLAERGYVTFAPHNPYRGGDLFRTLQRKLNPLGLTLYSVIFGQHQRILDWLQAQPFAKRRRLSACAAGMFGAPRPEEAPDGPQRPVPGQFVIATVLTADSDPAPARGP